MKGHFARLAKQTGVYGIGAVAQQLLGVITLPIYARVLSKTQYGGLEVITVGIAAISIVADAGFMSASQRSYFDYTDEQYEQRRVVLSSAMVPTGLVAALLGVLVVVLSAQVTTWLFGVDRYQTAVILAGLSIPAITLAAFSREVMRLRFQPWHYLAASLVGAGAGTVLAIVLVLATSMGINGVLVGTLAGNVLAFGYGLAVSLPHIGRRISGGEIRTMLAYGLPLVATGMAMWMLQFVDRIMLSKLANLAEVGEYAVANRLGLVLLLLVSAFGIAYAPFMLSLHAEDEDLERRVRGRLLTYVTGLLVTIAVLLGLFAREILSVIAPRFDTAYQSVGLLSVGMAALGISQVAMSGIALTRRSALFVLYAGAAAAVNVGLNFVLIPPWGQVGAATATALAYIVLAALYYHGAQR